MSRYRTGVLFALTGTTVFSFTLPMVKLALPSFDPWTITFARMAIAGVTALIIVSIRRVPRPPRELWPAIAVTGFGISLGYHRLHTHQSYQCPLWMQYALAVCGTLTLEGGPIFWVGTHRIHHAKSDQPGDPHSPREGWVFTQKAITWVNGFTIRDLSRGDDRWHAEVALR